MDYVINYVIVTEIVQNRVQDELRKAIVSNTSNASVSGSSVNYKGNIFFNQWSDNFGDWIDLFSSFGIYFNGLEIYAYVFDFNFRDIYKNIFESDFIFNIC